MTSGRGPRIAQQFRAGVWISLAALSLLTSCTTFIVPPAKPDTPVSIFVVDYGRHASLLLPASDDRAYVEWAYGEWRWWALAESAWVRVFPVLMWPTRGTLGRRQRWLPRSARAITERLHAEQVHEIVVGLPEVATLSARLQAAFDDQHTTLHRQGLYGLDFVHHEQSYHLFHTCNHAVAEWLQELGCQVHGWAVWSAWEVRPAYESRKLNITSENPAQPRRS